MESRGLCDPASRRVCLFVGAVVAPDVFEWFFTKVAADAGQTNEEVVQTRKPRSTASMSHV
jgi:hypothetical protein